MTLATDTPQPASAEPSTPGAISASGGERPPRAFTGRQLLLLLAITGLGASLRLFHLGE